ncbi:MAG TPA: EF-P lysine aminoacylase EpmA [Xanthomonadales bacterium]|nr:EF-P lysine aminoacylase EpmA [Xanthomonadales bacterium]
MNADDWRPTASRQAIEARARMLADIRGFFAKRKVLEVETAQLSSAGNSDPNIASIATATDVPRFLRTSAEYPMKRLLAAGLPDIYELGRVFRAGEKGRRHNPEFTMLEWYRHNLSYHELANEVLDLFRHCGQGKFDNWPVVRTTYRDLFRDHLGLDPHFCDEEECRSLALERDIHAGQLDLDGWLDLLLTHLIQPQLDAESITVIFDFLPQQAALACIREDSEQGIAVAERFEIYLGQTELANGYQELADPVEQQKRFEQDRQLRKLRGEELAPVDQRLLAALQAGLPECSGVAVGVDRLLMALLGVDHIDMVLPFPFDRA